MVKTKLMEIKEFLKYIILTEKFIVPGKYCHNSRGIAFCISGKKEYGEIIYLPKGQIGYSITSPNNELRDAVHEFRVYTDYTHDRPAMIKRAVEKGDSKEKIAEMYKIMGDYLVRKKAARETIEHFLSQ